MCVFKKIAMFIETDILGSIGGIRNNSLNHILSSFLIPDQLTIQTDRYCIDRNKSHYRLICHSNRRDICTIHVYTRMLVC